MAFRTIPEMLLQTVERYGSRKPAFLIKQRGSYQPVTYDELAEMVFRCAAALRRLGIGPRDRVGIVSENRLEWVVADLAIAGIGAVSVPAFPTLTAEQLEYIFDHSEAVAVFASNRFQWLKLRSVLPRIGRLQHIILFNDDPAEEPVLYWHELLPSQTADTADLRREYEASAAQVEPKHLLTLIYTSGTTGVPKGVMLTHANVVANIQAALRAVPIDHTDVLLSYLPLSHSYERTTGYYSAFAGGATIAFAESIETVAQNITEVRPTVMTSVPRLFERVRSRILATVAKEPPARQRIFHWAIDVGRRAWYAEQQGRVAPHLRLQRALADRLVFRKIRQRFGGRLRFFVSGGAALPVDVGEFFFAIGIPILEGYGLTEAAPVLTVNRLNDIELGTVGKPLDNVELRLAEDGEILARGPNIMLGYWKDPAATAEAIDADGWLHTGDIGSWSPRGNLIITDRKKHIFVSSGGKNIAPQPIEQLLCQSPYIDQCLLVGDQRPYCAALLVPDFEALATWAERNGISDTSPEALVRHPQVLELLWQEIERLQRPLARYERVRRFAALPKPFSIEEGELTPTLKIRRSIVEHKYATLIEALYTTASPTPWVTV
ncbi:MAG: long-chain fatty acid--CoA ligase [Candidatus Kapabacteria bacterium]|nr:long-chain fatty acid--CoA ligase [Candidatus Kapabacteria bacterium]MDW8012702.1 long-chain fatty acid--CoA ligase [Bacteroidota bacterium]